NQADEGLVCLVTLQKSRVVNDQVGAAPLALLPVRRVHATLDQNLCGARESRRGARRDLVLGIDRDQRGRVTVIGLCVLEVFEPFLQLAVTADLEWRQLGAGTLKTLAQIVVN